MKIFTIIEEIRLETEKLSDAENKKNAEISISILKKKLMSLKHEYILIKDTIQWNRLDGAMLACDGVLRRKGFNFTEVNSISNEINQIVNSFEDKFIAKGNRWIHFLGSFFLVLLIPGIKFMFTRFSKNFEINQMAAELSLIDSKYPIDNLLKYEYIGNLELSILLFIYVITINFKNRINVISGFMLSLAATLFIFVNIFNKLSGDITVGGDIWIYLLGVTALVLYALESYDTHYIRYERHKIFIS